MSALRVFAIGFLVFHCSTDAEAATFIRGDVDGDGSLQLTDSVRTLGHLFLRSPLTLACRDAADSNDSEDLDITDPIYALNHLFLGGEPPPLPYPDCGDDPDGDALNCEEYTGCPPPDGSFHLLASDKERDFDPQVDPSDLTDLVAGNTEFTLSLYQSIRQTEGNIFYSPYSISVALAMTYAGARGNTEQQMASALRFTLPQDKLHPAFNALDLELASRGEGLEGEEGDAFQLSVANSIWGQAGYPFLPDFLDVLAEDYDAGLRLLDFVRAPEPSRLTINDWVSEQTESRIQDLLPEGVITSYTRLVLTNAIYFKASWKEPFPERNTRDEPFHLLDGSQVTVPTMGRDSETGYSAGAICEAVELPYLGEELSMVILLPPDGTFEAFESALDAAQLGLILNSISQTRINLRMPKFEYEFLLPLNQALIGLGMTDSFQPGVADFSGIDGSRELFIHDVRHKAFVSVNETGTEAAAATAVTVGVTSVPPLVSVNRPFLFLIRDIPTGAILFLGRVVDPTISQM